MGLPEFVEAGAATTHLNFPAGADWASQERIAAEFARFAESDIDPGMPLVGRMASPGRPARA